ncbi:MAG TPA: DNA gyrase subunit A [Planctomycetes bacterium]|nr:DNA gyrase subunit A [Planctomycetota bacterium]
MSETPEDQPIGKILPRSIEEEIKESYLKYALSVIHSRALPDVRDGLKPSQRRILVAMNDLNLGPRSQHRKCAKICGDTSGNYHPHGEAVVYPTLVRMGQDFNSRYVLVDKQGNFGTIRPDNPAAMRYTEARMAYPAMYMLEDLDKDTVDFVPNYDETRMQPDVLPGRFPNLLCNGSEGIAVGMSTSMPPHNLGEVASAIQALLDNPEITVEELHKIIPGPDFPTGGIILGRSGSRRAYSTGRGQVIIRARHHIEEKKGRKYIIITEVPYQVTIHRIIQGVVDSVKAGRIDTISDINDETNARTGTRLVIELKKAVEDPTVTLNQLWKFTPLQVSYSIINMALHEGQPKELPLKKLLECYRDHRVDVITRRTKFLLKKAEARLHIIEGLRIALANIDEVVEIIKKSSTVESARDALMERFELTEIQARAILDMRLARLTSLEIEKLEKEYEELIEEIKGYKAMLADVRLIHDVIREQLDEMVTKIGDKRRTEISEEEVDPNIDIEDLIEEETMVVTISHQGYLKRTSLEAYRSQGRGGKGVNAGDIKEGDFLEHLFVASTHDYLLLFTNKGQVYWLKVYQLPEMSRTARGRALPNVLDLQDKSERLTGVLRVDHFDDRYLIVATEKGYVKKTVLAAYSRPKRGGIRALVLEEGDSLVGARLLRDHQDVLLATKSGQIIRFDEADARPMGRVARGVRGIKLREGDRVVSLVIADEDEDILTVCLNGYGKRTPLEEYRRQNRGGLGIINIKTTERNGEVVSVVATRDSDDVMLITQRGMIVRIPASDISKIGRNTQGVRIIRLKENDQVVACARVVEEEGDETEKEGGNAKVAEKSKGTGEGEEKKSDE